MTNIDEFNVTPDETRLSRNVAMFLGRAETEVLAGRMSYGDAVETVIQSVVVDADEIDIVRARLRDVADEQARPPKD